ncbi:MAG: hypothetical protein GQ527_09815, partial [Bacteroidales bacterium]|nr:hypothetical protein [Bacteroidales bacterium]
SQWNILQSNTNDQSSDGLSVRYQVQVGVYSNQINMDWVSSQLDNNINIDVTQNNQGKYVFSLGSFNSVEEARAMLEQVKEIVPDAFVTGFRGSQKIYIR